MNGLITKRGRVVECLSLMHGWTCHNEFKIDLDVFLKRGGVRVCERQGAHTVAVEHVKPLTDKQHTIITRTLKEWPFYSVVHNSTVKQTFSRPIRTLPE